MEEIYDVCVIGGGPAGLTAALYLARAKYRVLVLEKAGFGGQIAITDEVVNYPGVGKTDGKTLTETMRAQAEKFGAKFRLAEVTKAELAGEEKVLTAGGGTVRCLGVVLATGAHPREVGFQGEETHKGRGVAYCATCDGEFFTGKDLLVVGGGYAAAEESVFLTKFARSVTILIRGEDFSCAASVAQEARNHPKIRVLTHTELEEVSGENGLTYARWKDTSTGEVTEWRRSPEDSFGVFVFAGYAPAAELFRGQVALDERGYIVTDKSQKTDLEGVYAAGDVCVKPLRQVVTATGEGAIAATELEKYVAAVKRRRGEELHGDAPEENPAAPAQPEGQGGEDFDPAVRQQLREVFGKMERKLVLKLALDEREVSRELERLAEDLAGMTEKIHVEKHPAEEAENRPFVEICDENGGSTGLFFHGVPGGHEFTSFILALYNAAGPGQEMEETLRKRAKAIEKETRMDIFVTLSCGMCPELVTAAGRLAVENPKLSVHVYDLKHFETLRNQYKIMSVPCLVLRGEAHFGKKPAAEILELLER